MMHNFRKSITVFLTLILAIPSMLYCSPNDFAKTSISIGVVVEDLETSFDFYTKVVGMVPVREFSVDSEKAKRMGLSNGEKFDIIVLKLENSEQATEWKLMSFKNKSDLSEQNYIPDRNGIRYVTIFVKSMAPIIKRIQANKIKTLGESPTMLDETRQFVLIQDPDGNFVEFIGPK